MTWICSYIKVDNPIKFQYYTVKNSNFKLRNKIHSF